MGARDRESMPGPMSESNWQFSIDVGGTFTDVVAHAPDGTAPRTFKLLSSGAVGGAVDAGSTANTIVDASRASSPDLVWRDYQLSVATGDADHPETHVRCVVHFDGSTGRLTLDRPLPAAPAPGTPYALFSGEQAPVTGIRYVLGLGLADPIGSVEVRLGTTRGTNALLERKGPRTAFVTTKGFADALKIGNQDRPALFALEICKRDELATHAVEIDARMSADGTRLRELDERSARSQLIELRRSGFEALAICLLHAHVNPADELTLGRIAREIGFSHVSLSSDVSRLEGFVPRSDTTVVDAYLSPVIADYTRKLRSSLPDAAIKFMTSAGGLVSAATVGGKDTVLSGPAGGVLGCANVSQRAGFTKAIGFDMGGTSTDVCRIDTDHRLEYQHETVKAGVRMMTPMLAIETVAAGGGSCCRFDGQKLVVGPESAGSDPGPRCYGRNGPLTVTDMNVYLGRVVNEFFPFPLDRAGVETELCSLTDVVNAAAGTRYTPTELACGFLDIANANMGAAIKRISVAKGYDVRDYILTAFGGAGGQHACAIARQLGMTRVLCHPAAGVLSAWGIAEAKVKRIGERSVQIVLSDDAVRGMILTLDELAHELTAILRRDGVGAHATEPAPATADLCYAGQSTRLTVPVGTADAMRGDFERQHQQLYGYHHAHHAIEVRAVRVELSGTSPAPQSLTAPAAGAPSVERFTKMFVAGEMIDVPVHLRSELYAEQTVQGPSIIIEPTSTIVIDDGWEGTVRSTGELVLVDRTPTQRSTAPSRDADPIQLELFNNRFASVAEQMGVTLRRTALSTNVKERLDYSCAVFTGTGDLVVNAPHIPVHLGGMSDCVKCLLEDVGTLEPGDVYITNDPYRGGSHLNDITVITPVHESGSGRLLFVVASRAHHAEIGGSKPGSMPPDSTRLAEEGVLIRAFRWMDGDTTRADALREILTAPPFPSRCPADNLSDIAAQVASNQTGARALQTLMLDHGTEVVVRYMTHIQSAAASKMQVALRRLPDGVQRFSDRLDNGATIRLAITVADDTARFDFTGTDGVLPGNLNANRAIVTSAVLYCLRCLIGEDIPLNAGILEPVEIILPECFLNPAAHADPSESPAMVGGNVETSQRVVDTIFGALQVVAASQGTMNNLLIGDATFGYYETICGGTGAGPGFHGADAVHSHMTNTRLTDPEILESRYPVRLIRFAIRHGSGGRGLTHGGCGAIRELEFLRTLDVSILSQRRTTRPYGLRGGEPGAAGRNLLRRADSDTTVELDPVVHLTVSPHDRIIIETPGGGGWGRASRREGQVGDAATREADPTEAP